MVARTMSSGVFTCRDGRTESWTCRRSSKARRATVRVNPTDGIVVVLPLRSKSDPAAVVESCRAFVERALAQIAGERDAVIAARKAPLSQELVLQLTGERWELRYIPRNTKTTKAVAYGDETGGHVVLVGPLGNRTLYERALSDFVFDRAKKVLPDLLDADAREFDMEYETIRVTRAKKRWGSCSEDDRIMLSAQLMFLPPELVFHVIAHELAHTEHHDHSAAFHATLRRLDPKADEHEEGLRTATSWVPYWMA